VAFNQGTDKDTTLAFQGNPIRHPDTMDFAGDYSLTEIALINHQGEAIDIKLLVQELNIYESIYNNAVTGTVVITDAVNLINNLPIQGTERLAFKLKTPGTQESEDLIDCTEETGHPMHIFKLTHRQQLDQDVQMYILHFASREFMRNMRTKVSKSYTGTLDTMVNSIMSDKDGIDSRKKVTTQKTRNSDKIVIPNKQPFDAIAMLCKRALADNSKSVGYYFYETTKGFQFRSWESMCVNSKGIPRIAKQKFEYKPVNVMPNDGFGPDNIAGGHIVLDKKIDVLGSVSEYKFLNNFHDVSANTMMGTYGHRVITHNLYDKSYKISDYNYHNRFHESKHLDGDNPAIVDSPVDWDTADDSTDRHKNVSDYPESRVTVMPTTQFLHDEDTGSFGTDVENDGIFEGSRVSQGNQVVAGTRLEMAVIGQSYLSAGDVVVFNHRAVDTVNSKGAIDPHYSGRYIITAIRHQVTNQKYSMILECSKDSVYQQFETKNQNRFYANPHSERPTLEETD
jgi:hypothetical protein